MTELTRRQLLKVGAGSAGLALVPFKNPLGFDLRAAKKIQMDFRLAGAKEVRSLCPYCAVGCSLIAYTKEVNGKTSCFKSKVTPTAL